MVPVTRVSFKRLGVDGNFRPFNLKPGVQILFEKELEEYSQKTHTHKHKRYYLGMFVLVQIIELHAFFPGKFRSIFSAIFG